MSTTYLTTDELSAKIQYDVRTIRERLKDSVLLEGTHYVRPFGGRKILFVWEAIERDMRVVSLADTIGLPMANGQRDGAPWLRLTSERRRASSSSTSRTEACDAVSRPR